MFARNTQSLIQKSMATGRLTNRLTPLMTTPMRFFDLHEYHSKKLMGDYGINVQKGALARSAAEALQVAKSLDNTNGLVVKAQV